MLQRRRFYFILPNIDYSAHALFWNMDLSQFQLYIEAQTITLCLVCRNFQKIILIQAAAGKEKVFCILHMLMIHTIFREWNVGNVYDLHLKKINPFDIRIECNKITKSELLF